MTVTSSYPGEYVSLYQAVGLINQIANYTINTEQHSCSAVLDASVQVKAYLCTDDSFVGATDLAVRKAYTAQDFRKASNSELQGAQVSLLVLDVPLLTMLQVPGGVLWKVEITNDGLFTNAGGASLFNYSGSVVGGIGCAGVANDADGITSAVNLWNDNQFPFSSNDDKDDDDDCSKDRDILLGLTITFAILFGITLTSTICLIHKQSQVKSTIQQNLL